MTDKPSAVALYEPPPLARRSLILCAAGAILGLLIASVGLFTAQGTRTARVPPEDAAIVNSVPILRVDLIGQLRTLYGVDFTKATPSQKHKVLDDMIREELYVQRGVETGLSNDDTDVRSALVGGTEAQVAQDAMAAQPTQDELAKWYRAHLATYATEGTMTLHEWLLPIGSSHAAAASAGLRAGIAPSVLGLSSSGRVDDGEEFSFAARIHLGPVLFRTAEHLADGAISDPIRQLDAIHIIQMVRNVPPVPTAYSNVRDRVLRDFLADKVKRLQEGNERYLRKRADIVFADDLK